MAETVRLYYLFRGLSSALLFKTFLVFFYLENGLNFARIGILQSVFSATVILLEVPTGIWADRFGRGRIMGYGALAMTMSALGYLFFDSFAWFAFLEFLLAFGLTMTSGADSAFLFDALKRAGQAHRYTDLEGKAGAAKHVGIAVSALAGGILAEYDLLALFPASAAVVFLAYLAIRRMDRSLPMEAPGTTQLAPVQFCEAVEEMRSHHRIWWIIFYSALLYLFIRSSDTLLQPVLRANGYSYWKIGAAAAAGALAAAVTSRYTAALMKRFSERAMLWGLPVALIASYASFATGSGWVLILVFFANVTVQGLYSPFSKTLLNRAIRGSRLRATLLSLESAVKRVVVAAMMPAIGLVVDIWGLSRGILACAAFAVLAGLVLGWTAPKTDERTPAGGETPSLSENESPVPTENSCVGAAPHTCAVPWK